MNILYLQIRKDEETKQEELNEFLRFSGLDEASFNTINVFDTPVFVHTNLDNFDALFIGGSSDDPEDGVLMNPIDYPYIKSCEAIIQYAYDTKKPTFASCMGFQIAAWVLGGKVILDKENTEIGTYDITLSDAGRKDVLFTNIPDTFVAVSGHKKRATVLPPGAIDLASSTLCPFHAFTFADRPFYAFQFHPEIDTHDFIERLRRYIDRGYVKDPSEFKTLINTVRETQHANQLVKNFVNHILKNI